MSFGIALWTRDAAIKLKTDGIALTKNALTHIKSTRPISTSNSYAKEYGWEMGMANGKTEDLKWLL
jgi:hypothetical protein